VRYLALIGHIPVIVQTAWSNQSSHSPCNPLIMYHQIYIVIAQVLVGMLLNIRTYALYECDRRIKWLLVSVSAIVVVVGCWGTFMKHSPTPWEPSSIGCNLAISPSQGNYLAAAWAALLLFDITIFSLTLGKVLAVGRTGRRTLFDIIIRDGTMYFAFIAFAIIYQQFLPFCLDDLSSRVSPAL